MHKECHLYHSVSISLCVGGEEEGEGGLGGVWGRGAGSVFGGGGGGICIPMYLPVTRTEPQNCGSL